MAEEQTPPSSKIVSSEFIEMEVASDEELHDATITTPPSTSIGAAGEGVSKERGIPEERLLDVRSKLQYSSSSRDVFGTGTRPGFMVTNSGAVGSQFSSQGTSAAFTSPSNATSHPGLLSSVTNTSTQELLKQLGYSQAQNASDTTLSQGSNPVIGQQSTPSPSGTVTIKESDLGGIVEVGCSILPTPSATSTSTTICTRMVVSTSQCFETNSFTATYRHRVPHGLNGRIAQEGKGPS